MTLLRAAIDGVAQIRADVTGAPAPWDDFWYQPVGGSSSAGMRISPESAKRVAAFLACVGVVSRTVAALPLKIYREQSDGGKQAAKQHPVYDVLNSRPNDRQTSFEFVQMMQGHLELRGNAYAEIVPGPRGAVDQLIPMHPDRVMPELLTNGRLRYQYNDPLTGGTRTLVQDEVFHLRGFSEDGIVGQSPVALAADTLGVALAAQDYSARFFANDTQGGNVITGAQFKTPEEEQRFKDSWQRARTGPNRHKTAILWPGMDIKSLGITAEAAQLLDARKFSRIEICSLFPVPPHKIGETEKAATYASVEQFNIMFAVDCILPRLVMWEQAIQRDLIFAPQYFPKFSMAALLRGDTATRFAAYQVAITNGWMSQDDVRMMEDLNPLPNGIGKNYWRNTQWVPLGQTSQQLPPASSDEQTPTADPAAGDDANAQAAAEAKKTAAALLHARLKVLAGAAADRCVRKEVAALRKLNTRGIVETDVRAFYAEHAGFVAEVLRISPAQASAYCDRNCARLLDPHARDLFEATVNTIAAKASAELGVIAVESLPQ